MKRLLQRILVPLCLLLCTMTASAISGNYSDGGGGTYWCNVYVHGVAASKSYGWCTGDSEDAKMNEFRYFWSSSKISTENPTFYGEFRYNSGQSKDYKYKSSTQEIYLMTRDGALHKMCTDNTQTDYTYGVIECSWDGSIFRFRIALNTLGLQEVTAVQVESDSYFYQSNFWHRDYWFYIHARYLKGIEKDFSLAHEPKVEWTAPGKVKVSADNSWLPTQIGNSVSDYKYTANYDAKVVADGRTWSSTSFKAENRGNGSAELSVPTDRNFTVSVVRNTTSKFKFRGCDVAQDFNEKATSTADIKSTITALQAAYDQVDGELRLQWTANGVNASDGDYQIYRTELGDGDRPVGKRELAGTSTKTSFIDNSNHGLELNKTYRYEVFQQRKSWGDFSVPSDADKAIGVNAATIIKSSTPVIPMHLVQDTSVDNEVKMNWTFGNVPKSETDLTFKVHRIEPGGTITRNYLDVTVARDAGKATFSDEKPASICTNYGYFVQLDLADNKVHLYSDTVYAHVTGSTKVTSIDATKGTAGTDVEIKWKAQQVGTALTTYHVQRRYIGTDEWITINEQEGTGSMYSYTDKTAEPGRYYDYRVIAYADDCEGDGKTVSNQMRDVGFCRSSGVISGRVQFESGTAVKDVRVSLSGETGSKSGQIYHSRGVLETGNALTFKDLGNVVGENQPYTLQMYVRPDRTADAMTLMKVPTNLHLNYNSGSGLYDLKNGDVVVGAIPADEFTQVSLTSDGSNCNTIVAGNSKAVNKKEVGAQPAVPKYDESNTIIIASETGKTKEEWTQHGWVASNNDYKIEDGVIYMSRHSLILRKDINVPQSIIGKTVRGSIAMAAPWGGLATVTIYMYDNAGNKLDEVQILSLNSTEAIDWKTYTADFVIPTGTTKIQYQINGQHNKFWAGYYGPQFKDIIISGPDDIGNNWALLPEFSGYVDEVRLWNRQLGEDEILADADRIISGESDGLKAYITFDEGLDEYAFDSSCTNGTPNGNHVTVGANTRPSDIIPTEQQLSAYGMTDDRGEYEIRGIPFTGSGTRYSVYPTKGVHSFTPTSRSAFIGGTSLTINNSDFTDNSSFKVSGTVRYSGTTIPVDSVSFYVDGTPCNKNDKLIVTDANGEYEISVPIGNHYIEARRSGHTFEGAGRYPVAEGDTYEFLADTHLDFFDNTLATLAGRVTGGQTEGEKPLGYGQSKNTIGQAVIKLSPLDHPQRMINAVQHIEGTTSEWIANSNKVTVESASIDINSSAYRGGGDIDEAKYVYITTDAATGEFSAKLPPIRYKVESVTFPNNEKVGEAEMFRSIAAVNLTNPLDTIRPDTIYNSNKEPLPLFKCNYKMLLTYRSQVVMDITQKGAPAGAFGTDTITVTEKQKDIKLPLYEVDKATGKVTYNYGYPIFQSGRTYEFKVKAYEPYINYDSDKAGKVYQDVLRDSVVTFDNELGQATRIAAKDTTSNEGHSLKRGDLIRLDSEQVQLDSLGEATYKWNAGLPSLTKPYTRNMNASMVINRRTQLWRNDLGLNGIITGVIPTGNNFITAGPSRVQMVLRDPPGDGSSATWAVDTVTTDYTYTVRGVHNNTEVGVEVPLNMEIDVATGTMVFWKVTYNQIINENNALWKYDVNKTWDNHTSVTYTNSHSTSTNATMKYVGRDGDVFIGYSTNYIIGAADKVGLFRQDDGSWGVSMEETMSMDEKFNTHFEYSQKYIETTLFDNIKRTRNSMLKHINSMSEIEESPKVPTYYTFLKSDDPKYGTSNNDKDAWGSEAKDGFEGPSYYARFPAGYESNDSVLWCNEIIKLWKKTLADNEEDKLRAFGDEAKYKIGNESFETGSSVTNSTNATTRKVDNSVETFTTGIAYKGKHGYLLDKMGTIIISNTEIGYHQTKYAVDETTTSKRFSYTLNDTQRGNAHTVDIFKSPFGWSPIFRTRGGQTRCPYEDETKTKYYRPGQTLDYATMKLDNPHFSMPVRNIVDIPAGQTAQVQVEFKNESQARETSTSAILYVDAPSNPNGLEIKMDGQSLLNGTELWMDYGVPLTKTITIKQSNPSILDYENVKLVLTSSCNPSIWNYEDLTFSVHFIPAAPGVTLALDKNVLNLSALKSGQQVAVTISDINRQFRDLKGVRLKYRFAGDSQWVTAHEWLTDAYYTEGADKTQSRLADEEANIKYNLALPEIDGVYYVVAESMCKFDDTEYTAPTAEQQVVRDTRGPKLLGQAYPNTGILTPTDDITIRFNEAIRESYLTKDGNFFITGALNDDQVSHDVSLQFNGNAYETDAYLPISNTSFAATMWLKRTSGGTLLAHGTEGNDLSLDITPEGFVKVNMSGQSLTSTKAIPANKWVFLALNYVKSTTSDGKNTLTMLLAQDATETMLFDEAIVPDYNGNGKLSIGEGYHGMMHELVIWNQNTPVRTLLGQKDEAVAPYMPGLVGYWKMNEGHGTVVTDYARSRNIHLPAETWNIENTNIAAHLDGTHTLRLPIGAVTPRETDSYVVEMWFRGEEGRNAGATMLSVTDRLSLGFDVDNSMILQVYDKDKLSSLISNGTPVVLSHNNYNDGNWHHFALNVHRGISAVAYIDGQAVKTLAEQDIPAPAGDYLHVGSILKRENEQLAPVARQMFTGDIDEIRLWNVACDATSISANLYNEVDTASTAGLIAYYPMQHSRLDESNNIVTEFSLINKAPGLSGNGVITAEGDGITQAATAPALRTAPLKQNIDYDFTASDNEIFINLKTLPARMQGNMLTFTVKNVRDLYDNYSEPITWSAVVDYNPLVWLYLSQEIIKNRLSRISVTATLYNHGRSSNHFVITGLPAWITPSVTEGVLATDESQQIEFTIAENAPIGTHLVYGYAVNDDDIYTPILFNITVIGNEPDWYVNTDDYESSMTIIGQIYIDDKISGDSRTKVAAFVGSECRGVASPELMSSRDAYFVNLTVYGVQDQAAEQPLTFRIYDAAQGVVLGNVTTSLNGKVLALNYQPNGLMGTYDEPVAWSAGDEIEQLLSLKAGWNWVSFYVDIDKNNNDLESVLGHSRPLNTVKGKEGFAMNNGTEWVSNGLETMSIGTLYKIRVKTDMDHAVSGSIIDTRKTSQTIFPGWNWIGPLSIYNMSVGEAFADLAPTRGDVVKSKNQVALYDGYKWEGTLTAILPGMGYYYKSNGDGARTFHYPTIDGTYSDHPLHAPLRSSGYTPFTPVDHHQFSDNMNVVARVMVDNKEVDTLTLAAFIGDECRGVARATSSGLYMLTVAGNAEETNAPVRFATMLNGSIAWFNEQMSWIGDYIYGDLDNPQQLTISSTGIDDIALHNGIVVTPTIVADKIYIEAGSLLKEVTIFSANGARVLSDNHINNNVATINVSTLAGGVYIVCVTTDNGNRLTKRIIKK